ncbi:MAG: hypothetical protein WKF47_03445 [Geodermatophilaceae bacterium]
MSGQLSLFSVEDDAPTLADVEGLLVGGGALVRRGETVRVSVVVDCGWRAESLRLALGHRGLGGELGTPVDGRCSVRSGFDARLLDLARRWTQGAKVRVPSDFRLTPARLRLWAMAGGTPTTPVTCSGWVQPTSSCGRRRERPWPRPESPVHSSASGPMVRRTGSSVPVDWLGSENWWAAGPKVATTGTGRRDVAVVT